MDQLTYFMERVEIRQGGEQWEMPIPAGMTAEQYAYRLVDLAEAELFSVVNCSLGKYLEFRCFDNGTLVYTIILRLRPTYPR